MQRLEDKGPSAGLVGQRGDKIHAVPQAVNDFFYTTGGPQVFRLRNFRDPQLAISVPGGALDAISYAACRHAKKRALISIHWPDDGRAGPHCWHPA